MIRGLVLTGVLVVLIAIGIWIPDTQVALPLVAGLVMAGVLVWLLGRAMLESRALAYRPVRPSRATEPPQSTGRGILKTLSTGPISLLLATGLALPIGLFLPLPAGDRLMLGGVAVPFFWAGLALWAQGTDRPLIWTLAGTVLAVLTVTAGWLSLS